MSAEHTHGSSPNAEFHHTTVEVVPGVKITTGAVIGETPADARALAETLTSDAEGRGAIIVHGPQPLSTESRGSGSSVGFTKNNWRKATWQPAGDRRVAAEDARRREAQGKPPAGQA